VKLGPRSTLGDVAVAAGDALRRAGIRAILTGGACAHLHTGGAHLSHDADFVLGEPCTREVLDRALGELGLRRDRDRYVHPRALFVVEFARGPLGIGEDLRVRPVWLRRRGARTLGLSATDSCRDRLAVFYHWGDRQSLAVAVAIARRNRVSLTKIRSWSLSEGQLEGYEVFRDERARARRSAARAATSRSARS
jgi:hypothetical protein